jgi:PBP1b-binding outer membrane lipoprotein LpoB
MKKLLYPALLALVLTGCANAQKEEKAIQKEVLDNHDKVMADDEKAMINKMKLDTLIRKADSLKIDKQAATELSSKLSYADDAMSDWMKKLNLDNSGKNHDDIMKYWHEQKVQVKQIDSLLVNAVTESAAFIQKTTTK